MWVSDDIDEARARCSWAATSATNHIEEVMRNPGHNLPEELTSVVERRRAVGYQHNYERHLEETEAERLFLTDEVVDSFGIAGDGERCRSRLANLASLGVSEVASGFLNGELDQLRRVGDEIISR
jgi:hypothetical protein